MNKISQSITQPDNQTTEEHTDQKKIVEFPSLSAVTELNEISDFHKTIRVTDRFGIPLSEIQTTHTCVPVSQLPELLLNALIVTEDQRFFQRKKAYDFNALIRSLTDALWRSVATRRIQKPRGTSTIHMQVARFLMLRTNTLGYAYTEQGLSRKLQELKLAQALRETFTDEEILTVYTNHCVTAGRGMRGYHDISKGLFGLHPSELDTAQSLYLARLVKWNRHVPDRIIRQVRASLPELAKHLDWKDEQIESINASLDTLSFRSLPPIIPGHSHLIDLANEYWRQICRSSGMSGTQLSEMDIADPESMIRRFGNLTIKLTIDYRLQRLLEELVDSRGFGPDTVIRIDKRIGSEGMDLQLEKTPPDTIRKIVVLESDSVFVDPSSGANVKLHANDTLVSNIRYKKNGPQNVRRSCFYYVRDTMSVPGQYFSYAMMDSRTQQLLAYYSRDRLGSRLTSLLKNRLPNGSSLAKPILYALAYDFDIYSASEMASDELEVPDTCAWARTAIMRHDKTIGMKYLRTDELQGGYPVHNFSRTLDGYDFLFNHLARSNNILAVETIYRLNTDLRDGRNPRVAAIKRLFGRLGVYAPRREVTGADIYEAIAATVMDSSVGHALIRARGPSHKYSVALGTLELTLYEQMHLFNALYNNRIVKDPASHPGLVIKQIELAGKDFPFKDSVEYVELFENSEKIKPALLALHKRLISGDRSNYDMCGAYGQSSDILSNFAKSGTTDDIIRPFNVDAADTARTNYGLWNAVLRLRLTRNHMVQAVSKDSRLSGEQSPSLRYETVPAEEVLDVTLTSIGECNQHYTGNRDGKTLHGYLSRSLLHKFGMPCTDGFYSRYEAQLAKEKSNFEKYGFQQEETDLSFFSRTLIKLRTGGTSDVSSDDVVFERTRSGRMTLRGKSYRKMLSFAPYMGKEANRYRKLVENLKNPGSEQNAISILMQIREFEPENQLLRRDLDNAVESLLKSY